MIKWTLEACIKDALHYKSKSEWEKYSGSAYNKARKNKWLIDCCSHMILKQKPSGYWNLENCMNEALKYNIIPDWQKQSASSYAAACSKGYLKQCINHMIRKNKPANYWSFEKCKEEALKYKSLREWQKNSHSSYLIAGRKKWKTLISTHMKRPVHHSFKWSLDACIADAKKYNTKQEWRHAKQSGYSKAKLNNWLDICCNHMKLLGSSSRAEKQILNLVKAYYYNAKTKRFTTKTNEYIAKLFELDIYIPELNKGIEFDGKYWHSFDQLQKRFPNWKVEDVKRYDYLKDSFFRSIGIQVLHVKEQDWLKDKQTEINKIHEFIGI